MISCMNTFSCIIRRSSTNGHKIWSMFIPEAMFYRWNRRSPAGQRSACWGQSSKEKAWNQMFFIRYNIPALKLKTQKKHLSLGCVFFSRVLTCFLLGPWNSVIFSRIWTDILLVYCSYRFIVQIIRRQYEGTDHLPNACDGWKILFFLMATCFSGSAVELSAYTVYVCFGRFGSIYWLYQQVKSVISQVRKFDAIMISLQQLTR